MHEKSPYMIISQLMDPNTVQNESKLILLLLLKKVGSARLRESVIHPISPKIPAPQYQPRDRKKRREK